MGERRSRKSLWTTEEEASRLSGMREHDSWAEKERQYRNPGGRYREFAASGTAPAPKSRDPGWRSWESMEENPPMSGSFVKSRHNAGEGKEVGGGDRYRNPYNGFDEMERRNYDQTHEDDRMNNYRYPGRGRSRSRSRSRTRGRSRSRSLSRSRGKERGRWSRSRSRSRSNGNARGRTRSRSPSGYRREPYGWSDRKSGPDKSSQICRDFAGGRCRRGSQCRFFHPDNNTNQRDGDFAEDESWRRRADHDRVPRHAVSRSQGFEPREDDVSGRYHGEEDRFPRKSRSAVPCKDFMKGNCRWGDTCKFSHHIASDTSYGKSNRNSSFDEDSEFQANKNTKPLCKYFAAGKCGRDNCRFSHEDPKITRVEDGRVTDSRRLPDKRNSWDGPTWDDGKTVSDNVKATGWDEPYATNPNDNTVDHTLNNGKGDGRWANSPDLPEWEGNSSLNMEKQPSPPKGSGTYGIDAEMTELENTVNRQGPPLLHHPEVQNQDRISNFRGLHTFLEAQAYSVKPLEQHISTVSHIPQQHHGQGVAENSLVNSGSDVLHANVGNMSNSIISSEAKLNQIRETMIPAHLSVSTEKDSGPHILRPESPDDCMMELNSPEKPPVLPLNLNVMQSNGVTVQSPVPQFFPNLLTSQQPAQMTNPVNITGQPVPSPSVILGQRFGNEQPHMFAGVEASNDTRPMPSISDNLSHANRVNANSDQPVPVAVSHDMFNPSENGRGTEEPFNDTVAQAVELNGQTPVQESAAPPPPIAPTEMGYSRMKHQESPKLQTDEVVAISQANGGTHGIGEESKSVQETKASEAVGGQGKVEEAGANKDEKGMRMLKNALIELVKELLKPKWKEGKMSRDIHKTIVKKVVDKVTSTITGDHIPKTQDRVDLYLSSSKPKINKLVQAYVERCMKAES